MARRSASAETAGSTPRSGQLTVERDFLAKRPGRWARPIEERWSNGTAGPVVPSPMRACGRGALGVYRPKPVAEADDLAVMRRIDELHLELPFYGSRRMTFELNKEGPPGVNRKRVRRLMRVMGIEALVPRPGTSKAAPGHKIYPYLLRGLKIVEPNHVWAADVTYIPMAYGFLYLVAIIDWASRAVLAWRRCRTPTMRASARRRGGGAASVRKAGDFQYRSGRHFHRRGFHQQACDGRRRDFDGRTRPLHGRQFHRTAVALDPVRKSASESLRRWLRGAVRHQFLDELSTIFGALTRR